MNPEVNQIVVEFNSVFLDFIRNIAVVCPNSIVGRNMIDIEKSFKNMPKKNSFIDAFVAKVLPYKSQIDEGNEDFFIKKDYSSDLDGNESWGSKVFEFKNIWSQFKKENKTIVIQYMQALCELAQEYFLVAYG
ncbi:MAG: hypothetical protein Homavirus13_4 [Homavirus sp.]|uniref:Uncharacterized protein n=1 Tax=Homavirus sp. TaxID=2487769 RepID=A0A3G5A4L7_9VIRU|nr:MAG: hypothetical protein Homavirus13_4 [Homavirus sp.]